jgi:hypothetical protein
VRKSYFSVPRKMKLAVGVQDAYQNKDLQLQSYAGGSKSPPTSLAAIPELLKFRGQK